MISTSNRLRASMWALVVGGALLATSAQADVTISSAATKNMTCSGGICTPTANNANLSVSDLESKLKSGSVTVTTTGSGSVQAKNIVIDAALKWSSANGLTLSAAQSIAFDAKVSITGKGGLTLNVAGVFGTESLAFYNGANVTFSDLSSPLTINGNAYVLVDSVAGFASAVSANQNGYFALAASYDASGDGTYSSAPVQGNNATGGMNGVFEGLGNTISNLTIVDGTASGGCDGLMANAPMEQIGNFGMVNVSITSTGTQGANGAGAIVCNINSNGLVWRSFATGSISMQILDGAGGLVAGNAEIVQSWANVAISGTQGENFGGLTTGGASQIIQESFSMGPLSCSVGFCQLGGLAVNGNGQITDSYSVSEVTDTGPSGDDSYIGGFLSTNGGYTVEQSYAAGTITSPDSGCNNSANCVGGLYGMDITNANTHVYWDTTTTGYNVAAGNESIDPGTKGLKNKTFKAKLPRGFSAKIWAQSQTINHGLPYLIANPPPQ